MKVLALTEDFYPNLDGGALVQWRFSKLVSKRGHDITVLTSSHPDEPSESMLQGVRIIRLGNAKYGNQQGYEYLALIARLGFSLQIFLKAFRLMRAEDFDCIYSPTLSTHWAASTLSTIFSVPHVSFVGGTPSVKSDWKPTPKFVLERLVFKFTMGDVVFCRNFSVKQALESKGQTTQITHGILNKEKIRDAVNQTVSNEGKDYDKDRIQLVFVGRLVPLKNPEAALDIVRSLPQEYQLLVVGGGPQLEELQSQVKKKGLSNRVSFTGQVSHSEALQKIAFADGLILTSNFEAHPTVAFEGLSLGCEVFATPVGTLPSFDCQSLHTLELNDMAERIRDTRPKSDGVSEPILEKFSVERFTDTVLSTMSKLKSEDQ